MSTKTDFYDAWERLDQTALSATTQCLRRMKDAKISPRFTEMLLNQASQEAAWRADLRSKSDSVNIAALSAGELAEAWHGALALQRLLIFTEVLVEFANLLMTAVCFEMAARLHAMGEIERASSKAGGN